MPFFEHRRHTFPVPSVVAPPGTPEQPLQEAEEEEEEQQREEKPEAEGVEPVERAVIWIRHDPRRRWSDLPALGDSTRDAGVIGNPPNTSGQQQHQHNADNASRPHGTSPFSN